MIDNKTMKNIIDRICLMRKGSADDKQFRATVEHNIDRAITEGRKSTVKDIYNGCKHYSNGNDDFAGTWIELYAKQKGVKL